jgi:adenosylcobinamide-GDP ribazoletransferase
MSTSWRPLLSVLRSAGRVPARYLPLAGMLVGAIGGAVYWLAAQFWPSSVAVVLSLFATALIGGSGSEDSIAKFQPVWLDVFVLFIKYNALMALTAANLPFSVPANLALGLIMVCGQAASHGLLVSVLATRTEISPRVSSGEPRVSNGELGFALGVGFAPAAFLGIPGLAGLVAAIVMRLGLATSLNRRTRPPSRALMHTVQPLTEACFYLGALAMWKYV